MSIRRIIVKNKIIDQTCQNQTVNPCNDCQTLQFVVVDYSQQRHEQCLEWRQAEAAQQHVLELEWEIQGEGGLGVCACRLADLAHHLDCVGTYRHLKELWTEIRSQNRLYQRHK